MFGLEDLFVVGYRKEPPNPERAARLTAALLDRIVREGLALEPMQGCTLQLVDPEPDRADALRAEEQANESARFAAALKAADVEEVKRALA